MQGNDDLEADDALAVLKAYWPIGQKLADAEWKWATCHDKEPGYGRIKDSTERTLAAAIEAATQLPPRNIAQFQCGIEIEAAHIRYVVSQIAHFTEMMKWLDRNAAVLEERMRDTPMAEVWGDIPDQRPIDLSTGYAVVNSLERPKSLFQIGDADNVPWVSKLAARLGLTEGETGGMGAVRVRSSQRVLLAPATN